MHKLSIFKYMYFHLKMDIFALLTGYYEWMAIVTENMLC